MGASSAVRSGIDHVIVLMLENRSFDHMLGYHPDPRIGTLNVRTEACPIDPADPASATVQTSPEATPQLKVGPPHSPTQILQQVYGGGPRTLPAPMNGFISSYQSVAGPEAATDIMRCFSPTEVPVLARLASDFAVFTRWFASVPGETWPNRNFAHAGTSGGHVGNKKKFYDDATVFERIAAAGHEWGVFHDGIPQVWVFDELWRHGRAQFHPTADLLRRIRSGSGLPAYSFVEPNHGFGLGHGDSQHPTNNEDAEISFRAGEHLIGTIYNALVANPDLFDRTLFLVTYDEHGGFYDHVSPVPAVPPAAQTDDSSFAFDHTGVRVPAIAVNPRIASGTVISEEVEHSAIAKTVRMLFAPDSEPLSAREFQAPDLIDLLDLAAPASALRECEPIDLPALPEGSDSTAENEIDEFEASLLDVAAAVRRVLSLRWVRDAAPGEPTPFVPTGPIADAADARRISQTSVAAVEIHELIAEFHAADG